MNVIGFDLDGVVFYPPVPFYGLIKKINFNFLLSKLRKRDFFNNFFYGGMEANQQVIELIKALKKNNHKIVIISGHSIECEKEIVGCLRKSEIPFDDLQLCPNGNSRREFKLKKIQETNCSFYIEDRWDIVSFLRKKLGSACYVIHYHKRHSVAKELGILFNI